ncbi:MAG: hypothetical protein ABRQ39_30160 [Candidatus Eremiobacterota bacterium]
MNISNIKSDFKYSVRPEKAVCKESEDYFVSSDNRGHGLNDIKKLAELSREYKSNTLSSLNMDNYMIPASEGQIKHLCLTCGISLDGPSGESYKNAFKVFLQNMPSARFTVLTSNEDVKKQVQNLVDTWSCNGVISNPERVNIAATGKKLSIWAQDSTLVVGNKLIEPARNYTPSEGDKAVPGEISRVNKEFQLEQRDGLFIDGGNQLATEDTLFLGSDAVSFMMEDMKKCSARYSSITGNLDIEGTSTMGQEELCKLMLEKTFPCQKIVYIGNTSVQNGQPEAHIDLFMTPLGKVDPETGKQVVIVADPYMACKILMDLKEKDPEKYSKYEESIKSKLSDCIEKHPLDTMTNFMFDEIFMGGFNVKFNEVAQTLEKDGYKVERVPYFAHSSFTRLPSITYNNGLIDGDNFFIPAFDIPELDDVAAGVYRKYGYNVIPLEMTAISSHLGAINCMTKVLEREYSLSEGA